MKIDVGKLTANNNTFYDNAAMFREETHAAGDDNSAEILRELQRVRERLNATEPMIAKAVAELEKAVQSKDKPKISTLLADFSSGTAKAVIAAVASKKLLSWMGIV